MSERIKLSRLLDRLNELDYPRSREEAAEACRDTVVTYAEGEDDLGSLIEGMSDQEFDSANDLYESIQTELPIEAVGEPGQSEGEG